MNPIKIKQLFVLLCCFFSYQLIGQVDYYPSNVKACIEAYEKEADSLMQAGRVEDGMRIVFEEGEGTTLGKS
jgi:hypothetical protein